MLRGGRIRKLPFTVDMVARDIIYLRARGSFGRPSNSTRPEVSCILAKHVLFQYRTGLDEMRLVSVADLRQLRIPYERITVYKITVP